MDNHDETKSTRVGSKHYCDFCGSECKVNIEYEDRERYEYHTCNCEKSKEYVSVNKELKRLKCRKSELEKEKHIEIRSMLADRDIKEIRLKYKL